MVWQRLQIICGVLKRLQHGFYGVPRTPGSPHPGQGGMLRVNAAMNWALSGVPVTSSAGASSVTTKVWRDKLSAGALSMTT